MRFKIDENLHPDAAEFLRRQGHDALTVWDESLRGMSDEYLARTCRSERRALLTFDLGFADIRAYPPEEYAGLIVLRLGYQSRVHAMNLLPRVLQLLKTEPLIGKLWIIEENSVRVRGGDEKRENG